MFRNDDQRAVAPVRLALSDGRILDGKLMLPTSGNIKRVLSGDDPILEFETNAGVQSLLAKSAIVEIMQIDKGSSRDAAVAVRNDTPDPYGVLGLASSATAAQTRTAFDTLSSQYHPDRFIGMGLPEDVLAYIAEKSQRIDAAYASIDSLPAGAVS